MLGSAPGTGNTSLRTPHAARQAQMKTGRGSSWDASGRGQPARYLAALALAEVLRPGLPALNPPLRCPSRGATGLMFSALARGNVPDQLGERVGVAGAFGLSRAKYPTVSGRGVSAADCKLRHYRVARPRDTNTLQDRVERIATAGRAELLGSAA